MTEKLDELYELNEKFYKLFGRLFTNRKLLNDAGALKYFGATLFEQYKAEYQALKYKHEIKELPELERVKQRYNALVPRRKRPWYFLFLFVRRNRAARDIDREIYFELEEFFRKREAELKKNAAALKRLEAALDSCDSADIRTTAFDEPSEPVEPESTAGDVQATEEPK